MNILSGLWSKVAVGFAVVSGLFFMFIRYQSSKIAKLKKENNTLKATKKAQAKQDSFKETIIKNETQKIKENVNVSKTKSKLDRLNDM